MSATWLRGTWLGPYFNSTPKGLISHFFKKRKKERNNADYTLIECETNFVMGTPSPGAFKDIKSSS